MPLLHLARYRDIAAEVADRLISDDGIEVLVASGGVANAIASELLRRRPSGFAGLRIETIETFAARIVNGAGKIVTAPLRPGERVKVYYTGNGSTRVVERVQVED